MYRTRKNQSGFGVIEALLFVVILGIIGFTGWYVWHAKQNTDKNLTSNTSAQPVIKKKTTTADQTADWKSYTSTDGKYSLKYPKTWLAVSHPGQCTEGLLLLGPTTSSIGSCSSKSNGEIAFMGLADSSHLCYDLAGPTFTNITKSTVMVSGVTLTKQSGTTANDTAGNGALPKGTLEVTYCYGGSGRGYMAIYDQKPTDPNVLNDFNTIVTKTLKFN